ncbi:MAG: DUF4381 domain-containing protein [Gammaproteobacteria bacterium]|nr:DUF4381 domain-containing protein [Gammaproteobacteria bacterium]MDH3449358.1 DUF4381 domain-containing protein [Gammaproteobacteria bacterium]
MTSAELLLELKDIAAPDEPGWWLLAPGQIAIGLLVAAVISIFWLWTRRRRAEHLVNQARRDLLRIGQAYEGDGDGMQLARELSRWLRQVALLAFPDRRLEAITGPEWLAFLDETIGDASFSRGPGGVFADAIYQRQMREDADQLLALCERWLTAIRPRLRTRGIG